MTHPSYTPRTVVEATVADTHWHSGPRKGTVTWAVEVIVAEDGKNIAYQTHHRLTREGAQTIADGFVSRGTVNVYGMERIGDVDAMFDFGDDEPEYDAERVALDRAYAGAF